MNIDERIEALTQSVELLASLHKDNEEQMAAQSKALDARFAATEKQISQLGKFIRVIATMTVDHETRLSHLEGKDDEDEADEE